MTTARRIEPHAKGGIPLKRGFPIIGNIPGFRSNQHIFLRDLWQDYGDLASMKIGPFTVLVISHPDLVQEVLVEKNRQFLKVESDPNTPRGLKLILGDGLLTNAEHDSWLSQRRMMQPMFHRRRISAMGDKMVAATERMLTIWDDKARQGETVEIHDAMMHVTMDIITRTMFSMDITSDAAEAGHAVTVSAKFVSARGQNPLKPPLSWPTPANREFRRSKHELDSLMYRIINERRASGGTKDDLLDMLLEARDEETGEGMNDTQLRDEVVTIFAAGHETTSNALTWTLYLLTQNPAVMQRLHQELDSVLGGRTPTLDDLKDLPYTLMVLEESMRLMPPVPFYPRISVPGASLAGHTFSVGTPLLIAINNIHQHPDFWPDPTRFDPERFHPEHRAVTHRLAYMPFGAGPRLCIGNNFALMEGQLLLAMMAQRFDLELVPGQQIEPEVAITMRPRYGINMRLKAR